MQAVIVIFLEDRLIWEQSVPSRCTHSFCRSTCKLDIQGNYGEEILGFSEPTIHMNSAIPASGLLYWKTRERACLWSILSLITLPISPCNVLTPHPHSVPSNFQYLFAFLYHFSFLPYSNTWLRLHFGPPSVISPTSSAFHCALFNLISSTLWLAYYFPAIKFRSHFQSFPAVLTTSRLLLCFGSATLVWDYIVHLPTTLISPTSSSWLISSGTSPSDYPVLSLSFCTTMLSAS